MAPQDDLKAQATASSVDFYELLSIEPTANESEIRRAYRKTSLKYHPDKVGATPENLEKFHLLQIANDVLSDPAIKALYDQSREARERRKREHALMDNKRKQMIDDLERRERGAPTATAGVKRSWASSVGAESAEERLQREVARIAAENRRKREQMNEDMRRREREALEAEEQTAKEKEAQAEQQARPVRNGYGLGGQTVPEIERTIKVRWPRGGVGDEIDKDGLESMFSKFGTIEHAFLMKDKKQRTGENKEKRLIATGIVVYTSIIGAHAAVSDFSRQSGAHWRILDSVYWAGDKEPEYLAQRPPQSPQTSPESPEPNRTPAKPSAGSFASLQSKDSPSTPIKEGVGLKKVPSFASFRGLSTPKGSPGKSELGPNSPSFEEMTMMRLKNAQREKERKKLEEQIRREEAAVDEGTGI